MSPISPRYINLRSILFYLFVAVGVLLFVIYVLFQARFMLEGPQITLIDSAASPQTTERLVTLEGTARNIVRMTLNGRQIYTDASGNFKEALVLENGYTIATLRAEDRYGRTTDIQKEYVHTQNQGELGIN